MDVLCLPKKIISYIILLLPLRDIYNFVISNSHFNEIENTNWDDYFTCHTKITNHNIEIDKNFMINYGTYLLKNFVYDINKLSNKLNEIKLIIDKYKNDQLYNTLNKINKPVFLQRSDFIGQYVGWTSEKTIELLNNNINKIIIIKKDELMINIDDSFGYEALQTITIFIIENFDKILVIYT